MGSDLITFPPSTESAELAAARAKVADLEIQLSIQTRRAIDAEASLSFVKADCSLHVGSQSTAWKLASALGLRAEECGPFDLERLIGLAAKRVKEGDAAREILPEIAKILGCGREVTQVFDAITRLKEHNATLTSETASQFATERAAHRATIVGMEKYGKTPAEVLGAMARMEQEVERLRGNVASNPEALFHGFIRTAVEIGTDGQFVPVMGHSATQMVRALGKEWLEKSRELDELRDKLGALDAGVDDDDPDPNDDDDDDDVDDGDSSAFAVVSLQTAIAIAERDWASTPGDAWIYGVVIGWDAASLTDLAARFGWKQATLDHLSALHEALVDAETEAR